MNPDDMNKQNPFLFRYHPRLSLITGN